MFYCRVMARTRFVWVRPAFAPSEMPGLVLEWRRGPEGSWQALVTWVETRGRVITAWVPVDELRPVSDKPRTGSAYG
jgi:hypothetical protein